MEPSRRKVDLIEIEVGPPAQKIELAGCGVAFAQLRVVLTGRMAEWAGQLVGLIGFEAGQLAQVLDYTGWWVGFTEREVDQLAQMLDHTGWWFDLAEHKIDQLV